MLSSEPLILFPLSSQLQKLGNKRISLLWWVVSEGNTLLNISLQACNTSLEKFLLLIIEAGKWVDGLLSSVWL